MLTPEHYHKQNETKMAAVHGVRFIFEQDKHFYEHVFAGSDYLWKNWRTEILLQIFCKTDLVVLCFFFFFLLK
jgi:hypothetical protein